MSAKNGELEIHPESGYEFDKFANTTGKDDTKTNDLIKYLKSEHEKFQETEADVCITCLKQQVKKI